MKLMKKKIYGIELNNNIIKTLMDKIIIGKYTITF